MGLKKKDLEEMFEFNTREMQPAVKAQLLNHTGRGGQAAARDYIQANCLIAEYLKAGCPIPISQVSKAEMWKALPASVKFRLAHYTPALAARYDELKEAQQNDLFENKNWVASEKINGVRGWLIHHNGTTHLFSRNYSDVDCGLLEYWNNIDQTCNCDETFAVDVEIKFHPGADISAEIEELGLSTDSTLEAMVAMLHTYPDDAKKIQKKFREKYGYDLVRLNLIAPLYYKGVNYIKRPIGEGLDLHEEVANYVRNTGVNIVTIKTCAGTREEKEIFLDTILNNGGEGVVFWNRKGEYCTSENRSKTCFIKLKRSIKTTSGLGDSFDAFVGGFGIGKNGTANEGMIGSFDFYIYENNNGVMRKHHIASIAGISREERQLATINDASGLYPIEWTDSNGETHYMSLNPDFDGMVAEITGQALSAKSRRLEHSSLVMWRTERSPESCIYTKEFLDSQTTNIGIKY